MSPNIIEASATALADAMELPLARAAAAAAAKTAVAEDVGRVANSSPRAARCGSRVGGAAVPTFTHVEHFSGDRNAYPYNHLALVHWFYGYSQFFVDLFFVLSGVVMTYRYLEPLSARRVDGHEFSCSGFRVCTRCR